MVTPHRHVAGAHRQKVPSLYQAALVDCVQEPRRPPAKMLDLFRPDVVKTINKAASMAPEIDHFPRLCAEAQVIFSDAPLLACQNDRLVFRICRSATSTPGQLKLMTCALERYCECSLFKYSNMTLSSDVEEKLYITHRIRIGLILEKKWSIRIEPFLRSRYQCCFPIYQHDHIRYSTWHPCENDSLDRSVVRLLYVEGPN